MYCIIVIKHVYYSDDDSVNLLDYFWNNDVILDNFYV